MTDFRIFNKGSPQLGPQLDLKQYLSPTAGFVRRLEFVRMKSFPIANQETEEIRLEVKAVKERLVRFRGFKDDPPDMPIAAGKKKTPKRGKKASGGGTGLDDPNHPCPVSPSALRDAAYEVYDPIDNEENRRRILDLWAGLVYVVDMSQDFRYYPTTNRPYPMIRAVEAYQNAEYKEMLANPEGNARWTEVSQFASVKELKRLVNICLQGDDLNVALVEQMAPKWKAVADDLLTDRLHGLKYDISWYIKK